MTLVLEQALNGVQLGVLLFLLAAGLTLVFGIMNFVNLAHGSLYMLGAYFAATFVPWTGSFIGGALLALGAVAVVGMALEILIFRRLYHRGHLDQVLATFGLILFFNELVLMVWGPAGLSIPVPPWLSGQVAVIPGVPESVTVSVLMAVVRLPTVNVWLAAEERLKAEGVYVA